MVNYAGARLDRQPEKLLSKVLLSRFSGSEDEPCQYLRPLNRTNFIKFLCWILCFVSAFVDNKPYRIRSSLHGLSRSHKLHECMRLYSKRKDSTTPTFMFRYYISVFVYSVRLEEKHVTEEKCCQKEIKLEPPHKITKPAIERKELHFVKFVTLAQTCWPGSLNLTAKVSTSFLRAVNLT